MVPKALVYQVICLEAVEEGIIPMRVVMGRAVPMHESEWDTKQAADVIELVHKRAATHQLWLTEYRDDGKTERVWYGGKP